MLIYRLVSLLLIASSPLVQAQNGSVTQSGAANAHLSMPSLIVGTKDPKGKRIGSPYLDTSWQVATIRFYQPLNPATSVDSLTGVPVRLNLATGELEVKANASSAVRVAKAASIRSVQFGDAQMDLFVNSQQYAPFPGSLTGFVEQVAVGSLTLLRYPYLYRIKANFNAAMGTGSPHDELIQKQAWYVVKAGQVSAFSPGRRAILTLMNDKRGDLEAYLKREQPDLQSKGGLRAVFTYYNQH